MSLYQEGILLKHPDKVLELEEYLRLQQVIREVTQMIIVLTSGTYDLQHPEHYRYLASARAMGDALIVLMDTDDYVKKRKGESRPILPFEVRATMLAYQTSVDWIIPHDGRDDLEFLEAIQPDVYVQSHATKEQGIEEKTPRFEVVQRHGGINVAMPTDNQFGTSTSSIIKRIK